jgi:hypothetical protein
MDDIKRERIDLLRYTFFKSELGYVKHLSKNEKILELIKLARESYSQDELYKIADRLTDKIECGVVPFVKEDQRDNEVLNFREMNNSEVELIVVLAALIDKAKLKEKTKVLGR